jgi:hypothetical protein
MRSDAAIAELRNALDADVLSRPDESGARQFADWSNTSGRPVGAAQTAQHGRGRDRAAHLSSARAAGPHARLDDRAWGAVPVC